MGGEVDEDFVWTCLKHQVIVWLQPYTTSEGYLSCSNPKLEDAPLLLNDYVVTNLDHKVAVVANDDLGAIFWSHRLAKRLKQPAGKTVGFRLSSEALIDEYETQVVCTTSAYLLRTIEEEGNSLLQPYSCLYFPRLDWRCAKTAQLMFYLKKIIRNDSSFKVVFHAHTLPALVYTLYLTPMDFNTTLTSGTSLDGYEQICPNTKALGDDKASSHEHLLGFGVAPKELLALWRQGCIGLFVSGSVKRLNNDRYDKILFSKDSVHLNRVQSAVNIVIHLHERELLDSASDRGIFVEETGCAGNFLVLIPSDETIEEMAEALKAYIEIIGTKRENGGKVAKILRNLSVFMIYSNTRSSTVLKFLSTGLFGESQRNESRKVILFHRSVFNRSSQLSVPGVTAVIDFGLEETLVRHPFLPLSIQFQTVAVLDQLTLVETMTCLTANFTQSSHFRSPSYYLLMNENQFNALPRLPASPLKTNGLDSCLIMLLLLLSHSSSQNGLGQRALDLIGGPLNVASLLEYLFACKCIDENSRAVPLMAERMLKWYMILEDWKLARLMAFSDLHPYECTLEAAGICAMIKKAPMPFHRTHNKHELSSNRKWLRLAKMAFAVEEGDCLSLLNVLRDTHFHWDDSGWLRRHMINKNDVQEAITMMNVILEKYRVIHNIENTESIPTADGNSERIQKALAAAFCCNIAILDQQRGPGLKYVYRLWKSHSLADAVSNLDQTQSKLSSNFNSVLEKSSQIVLTPSSNSFVDVAPELPPVVVFYDGICNGSYDEKDDSLLRYCSENTLGQWPVHILHITPIKLEWLSELLPHAFQKSAAF